MLPSRTKAAVNPVAIPPELSGSGLGNLLGSLSHGYVHEPFAGAWQRNVSEACDPSILAFSAVYGCISIISGDIAKLPMSIVRAAPKGGTEAHTAHPLNQVLWTPNHFQTRVDFMQQLMVSTLLAGNAYVWMERDKRGVISAMYVLDPRSVKVLVADTGDVFYHIITDKNKLSGLKYDNQESITLPASEIIHHRLMTVDHPLVGVTPLYAAGVSASVGANILMHGANFFRNQSRPSGVLVAPGKISKDVAQLLKDKWEENFTGGKIGRTAVLGDGLKWQPLVLTATDAQLIEQLRYSVEDVARVYRVPLFLLGDSTKVSYRNSEQLNRAYYSGCLQYHIESLEARFDAAFKLPNDTYIEFDLDPLLRTEIDIRFTAYQTAIKSGFKTINEVRAKEGDAPVAGGDEPLMQVQYVPLSQLKTAAVAANNPAPPAPPAPPASGDPLNPDDTQTPDSTDEPAQDTSKSADQYMTAFDQAMARGYIGGEAA
jgi:HK97 family phage portal protein